MIRTPLKLAMLAGLGLTFAGALYAPAAAAQPRALVSVRIGVAAPPPHVIHVSSPRSGRAWVPGHWRWNAVSHRRVWVPAGWRVVQTTRHARPASWVRPPRDARIQPVYRHR